MRGHSLLRTQRGHHFENILPFVVWISGLGASVVLKLQGFEVLVSQDFRPFWLREP